MFSRLFFLFVVLSLSLSAQKGSITISVRDGFSKKPLPAKVQILGSATVAEGSSGVVELKDLSVGTYTFIVSAIGYSREQLNDISVSPEQNLSFVVDLSQAPTEIQEVVLTRKNYKTTSESPLSLRNITSEEVQKNAGSNRDVSKALLSFPGVGSTATFRNDLFIRGGSSAENRFYVDGIEVPVINHFQTQGASGGPRGLITVDFIKDVDFYSGAFPASRPGTLSSLFDFNLKQARRDKIGYKAVLGLDDMQLMADGPLSRDQSWNGLFSVRKSNLQLLFKAIGLPFLPSYYDTTLKISNKWESGDEFYILGLGAIDEFTFNEEAENTLYNQTLIERLPVSPQWNYTIGAGYRHLRPNGNYLFTLSRNMLHNEATKYYRNIEIPENLLTDYDSQESENKLRVERNLQIGRAKVSTGANVNFARYQNASFVKLITQQGAVTDRYTSDISLWQYGYYLQGSEKFFQDALELSLGMRIDGSSYSKQTSNPFKQLSPRVAARLKVAPQWSVNSSAGIYYMLPSYTALGFISEGVLVNKPTLKYIRNSQLVAGVEYNGAQSLRITAEAYLKKYRNYPFSLRNGISLANLGGDFGVVGTEPLDSRAQGRTYGVELLAQKRTLNDFYGIMAYTLGYSEFTNAQGTYEPSSWDSRHILSITAGKYLKRDWNLAARFRLQSALPETPYDLSQSARVVVWNVANAPVKDFTLLNSQRGNLVHQLDLRAEKKWTFPSWQFTFYLDVVNAYGSDNPSRLPVLALSRDAQGNGIITNPDAQREQQIYQLETAQNDRSTPLPYFGFIFEF